MYCNLQYIHLNSPLERTMAANIKRKENPISMRLPEADIAMIDRAAVIGSVVHAQISCVMPPYAQQQMC